MSIVRYNPWGQQGTLPDEIKQVFDRFLEDRDSGDHSNVVTSQWAPRVDIKEEPERFLIEADIPGVDPKDIQIDMDNGILSIRGDRRTESRQDKVGYSRIERSHGSFYRRFALPDSADANSVSATGRFGVLEITIPKKPETKPRRIEVSTS